MATVKSKTFLEGIRELGVPKGTAVIRRTTKKPIPKFPFELDEVTKRYLIKGNGKKHRIKTWLKKEKEVFGTKDFSKIPKMTEEELKEKLTQTEFLISAGKTDLYNKEYKDTENIAKDKFRKQKNIARKDLDNAWKKLSATETEKRLQAAGAKSMDVISEQFFKSEEGKILTAKKNLVENVSGWRKRLTIRSWKGSAAGQVGAIGSQISSTVTSSMATGYQEVKKAPLIREGKKIQDAFGDLIREPVKAILAVGLIVAIVGVITQGTNAVKNFGAVIVKIAQLFLAIPIQTMHYAKSILSDWG